MENNNKPSSHDPGTERCQTMIAAMSVIRAEMKRRMALIVKCASIKTKKSPAIVVCTIAITACNELTTTALVNDGVFCLYSVQASNGWMQKRKQAHQRGNCSHGNKNDGDIETVNQPTGEGKSERQQDERPKRVDAGDPSQLFLRHKFLKDVGPY